MELLRFSVFWCGTILFGSILLEEAGELSRFVVRGGRSGDEEAAAAPTHVEAAAQIGYYYR